MLLPSEDETFVVESVTRFARARVAPGAPEWDRAGQLPASLGPELAELGLCGMLLDVQRGGPGFGPEIAVAAIRALAREDGALAWVLASHNLALRAAESMDLGPYLGGRAWMSVVGPVAPPEGRPELVALGAAPTHVACFEGEALRLVDASRLQLDPVQPSLGLRAARLARLVDGRGATSHARSGPDAVIGVQLVSAVALGIGWSSLDAALAYAKERRQFGRPIADFQGLQFRLADRATDLEAADALLRLSVSDGDPVRAFRAGILAARAARSAAWDAVQVFGGVGFVREYPVEKRLRDAQTVEGSLSRPERLRERL